MGRNVVNMFTGIAGGVILGDSFCVCVYILAHISRTDM